MSRFIFELGNKEDDYEIRRLLGSIEIEGNVKMIYTRDPSFFNSLVIDGEKVEVIVCRDLKTERIAGFGTRDIRRLYINQKIEKIGYLSNLRSYPEYRKGLLLYRGYQFLRDLHNTNPLPFYITTIVEENLYARKILESGRGNLPAYRDIGRYWTFAFKTGLRFSTNFSKINVGISTESEIKKIYEFLKDEGKKKNFFPIYTFNDIKNKANRLKGLKKIYFIKQKDNIVGTASLWDQSAFKQHKIVGYKGALRFVYPFSKLITNFMKIPELPKPPALLRYFYVALWCVKENNPDYLLALLEKISIDNKYNYDFFLFGIHESDSIINTIKRFPSIPYRSRVYIVGWDSIEKIVESIIGKPIYLELGTL